MKTNEAITGMSAPCGAKVIYIAGVPASGKTTLFKKLRQKYLTGAKEFRRGKVRGIISEDECYIMLGVFDGSMFEGTDKLSMTVIDDAIQFCNSIEKRCVIFIEGDRLFNQRFLSETRARLILIDAAEDVLNARYQMRGNIQSETFLRSRRTKVENFAKKYNVSKFMNNTDRDGEVLFHAVCRIANQWLNK